MVAHARITFVPNLVKIGPQITSTDAGRTDGRTFTWFYILSNVMRCIGQKKTRLFIVWLHLWQLLAAVADPVWEGHMASAGARACNGSLGRSHQRDPGAEPLVGGQGRSPLKHWRRQLWGTGARAPPSTSS